MKNGFLLLFLLTFGLVGCNPFSNGQPGSSVGINYHPGTTSNVPPLGGINGVKVTPGSAAMVGASIALTATMTPTNVISAGSYVRGRFSIQKFDTR